MIVAIDDDLEILACYQDSLTGYRLQMFTNPVMGYNFIKENAKDIKCLVLDKMMPPIDGVSMLKSLRLNGIDIPTVINTGVVNDEDIFEMELLNADLNNKSKVMFIDKSGDLQAIVDKMLGPRDNETK